MELSYRMQILTWLVIYPYLQWIKNPSMEPSIKNVTLVGVRTEVVFLTTIRRVNLV
ncbi:MAG: carbohydrate porin [Cycloclasticus sp.]|nr:carbohydrate porin [Cycloclasticus sp.]MBQ0789521.1 carbohydrate porin [Cycloclasticus sp.]